MSSNVLKTEDSVYGHSFTDKNGNNVDLSQFKDNLLLLVNVASNCGFTKQYAGLQSLHEKYKDKGLVVIGFPCNQFENQEPGTDEEIKEFCQKNYNVTFLMSTKIEVNGETAEMYINNMKYSSFIVDKMLGNVKKGGVGLYVDIAIVGYFKDLKIIKRPYKAPIKKEVKQEGI